MSAKVTSSSLWQVIGMLLYALLISFGAQFEIDIAGILPLTGQTLVVLTTALFTSLRTSSGAVMLYLLLGLIGFPVYADGHSGWEHFTGSSLGYFLGFFVAAALVSYNRKTCSGNFLSSFLVLFLGHLMILIVGSLFLLRYFSFSEAFSKGFQPFITGAMLKSVLGAAIYLLLQSFIKRVR